MSGDGDTKESALPEPPALCDRGYRACVCAPSRACGRRALGLLLVLIALALLRPAAIWWALVILASSAVLAAELFNTAVERLADHLHPDLHPEIRLVKDCAAGGVLISSAGAVAVAIALLIALIHGS